LRPGEGSAQAGKTSYKGEPVALNRVADLERGFQGKVHPILHGRTKLTLTAHWGQVANGAYISEMMPPEMCEYFLSLKPEIPRQEYSERDFSAFLPEHLGSPGQMWSLDEKRVLPFIKQFQRSASMHLVAKGRRVGPDGAFAVLRAVSPTYLDLAFRVHAEFDVTPITWDATMPRPDQVWYTPSFFSGRMIVDRGKGIVEYFHLGLDTTATLNVHLTAAHTRRTMDSHDIVRVDRMELVSGNVELAGQELAWSEAIADAAAQQQLKRVFYRFAEINWLPFQEALAAAKDKKRPIFAMVLWGNLDDQSC
jgi:hypothetical protein